MDLPGLAKLVEALSSSQKNLLVAQVIMSDRIERIEVNLEKASIQLAELAVRQNQTEASIEILTNTMNQWIQNHPNGKG